MKVFHDDCRPAPEGWTLARNNDEALELLRTGEVTHITLDHDLGALPYELGGDINARGQAEITGRDLARAMVAEGLFPPYIYVHSWSPDGAHAIANILADGYTGDRPVSLTIRPYPDGLR